jgi:hypothetical protein
MESVGTVWWVKPHGHEVINALRSMKRPPVVVEKVAGSNHARVLRAALRS